MVPDGPINRDAFAAHVEQAPAPEPAPGDAVVMDDLSGRKAPTVEAAIRAGGAPLLFLPPLDGAAVRRPISTRSSKPSPS